MLVFDQLKKGDPQLRVVTAIVLAGLGVLVGGLWWVQVVSARQYQANLETQSYRTVRVPAVRGRILDRNGTVLAENRATFNLSLWLNELRKDFDTAYRKELRETQQQKSQAADALKKQLQRELTREEKKPFLVSTKEKLALRQKARFIVASNLVAELSVRLRQPIAFDAEGFERHYQTRLALPYPVFANISLAQVALFAEQYPSSVGIGLETLSTRVYPLQSTAAHVLGSLRRNDDSAEGEEAYFSYRLPDYRGEVGIEAAYDKELRGTAGGKSVQVNNVGYRQGETVWSVAEPGRDVVLTLDTQIQQAAEQALTTSFRGPATRGAAVVMDVHSGQVLAMASSPTLNPNSFIQGFTKSEWDRVQSMRAEMNLATQENYAPGSIFKPIVGLAALEAGLDHQQRFIIAPDPRRPGYGIIYVGQQPVRDQVPPGPYDFRTALKRSSNAYFITNGLWAGIDRIIQLGQRLHLGERTGLNTRQEVSGLFPTLKKVSSNWYDGDTANLCMGQGQIAVTPVQMAVLTAAIANGGNVLWPQLVLRVQDHNAGNSPLPNPQQGRIRDTLGVQPRNLAILREAMLADVEDSDGTGIKAAVPGLRICGKTGTAQVKDEKGTLTDHITWFVSFAPYDRPKYAVVVMIESGGSGGTTCAPIAHHIYTAILQREKSLNFAMSTPPGP